MTGTTPATPICVQLFPARLELIGLGHVGHRAAGGEVGKNHLLMRRAEHVGAFRHEMHAAEDDVVGFRTRGDLARELERVAGVVGELDHFVALIVMAEDDEPVAELRARRGNARVHLGVGKAEVFFRQRLPLGDVLLLELRQGAESA